MLLKLDGHGPLHRRLDGAMREAILAGRVPPGGRLPSSRDLARELGLSRTTVQTAYEQLALEGYVETRRGAGTFVAHDLPERAFHATPPTERPRRRARRLRRSSFARRLERIDGPAPRPPRSVRHDFSHGSPPVADFPFEDWARIAARVTRSATHRDLLYGDPRGDAELRAAIAEHLHRTRGVRASADELIIVAGSQQALDLSARILLEEGDTALLEEPHYVGARRLFAAAGARLRGAPVDDEGLDPSGLPERPHAIRLAHLTPSHQFPTGVTMSLARRLALLEWAERTGCALIEDDYDSEYRYEGAPIASLKSLDRSGRVIYTGTFSKVLFPSLRLGYVVPPPELAEAFVAAKELGDRQAPTLEQRTLAHFLREGHFERLLRRERKANAARRGALLEALERAFGTGVRVQGDQAGLHVLAWLDERPPGGEEAALARLARAGVWLQSVRRCYLRGAPEGGLLLGFAGQTQAQIRRGVRVLAEAWRARN